MLERVHSVWIERVLRGFTLESCLKTPHSRNKPFRYDRVRTWHCNTHENQQKFTQKANPPAPENDKVTPVNTSGLLY